MATAEPPEYIPFEFAPPDPETGLRDRFAGQALPAILGELFRNADLRDKVRARGETIEDYIAEACYGHADAMLRFRARAA